MKAGVIFSIPVGVTEGDAWLWRSADHAQGCAEPFEAYAECVADAAHSGYTVEVGPLEVHID